MTAAGGEAIDLGIATDDLDDVLKRLRGGTRSRRRRPDRVGRRLGRAVRRRQDRHRDRSGGSTSGGSPSSRASPFAFGVADRPGGGAPGPGLRPAGQPGLVGRHLRAVRPPGDPAPRRAATTSCGPSIEVSWTRPSRRARAAAPSCASRPSATTTGAPVRDGRGRVRVRLAGGQGSHVISALAAADALAVIPEADDALPAGAEVALWWLDRA